MKRLARRLAQRMVEKDRLRLADAEWSLSRGLRAGQRPSEIALREQRVREIRKRIEELESALNFAPKADGGGRG